ncbi:MAG: Mov34/MPN/PAD-1 family protein [candidate division KSB1 bacterium]|nr:Mov34/MPN/PAD-1 family protein [candidate division KSB1 bacterium]MDZ7304978.1 Mov34/MPN/PAD-1 family protein [candidate division KSB1 bacterium]MDZ7314021.1 Mov34/MPN/PAD-1 family protein [candidate division KSB1 bacterium]
MPEKRSTLLEEPLVVEAFKQTWLDSQPGHGSGHEEGGFILRDAHGNLSVKRWPQGEQNIITVPPHPNCKIEDCEIIATFHTHPNTGNDFLQEPSETDRRAVRDDPNLKSPGYEGEYVISQQLIYLVAANGQVSIIGNTRALLTTV